jgi:exo-beta-1,3-glucanase (GH17 family)
MKLIESYTMRSHILSSFRSATMHLAQASIAIAATLVLAACGGGGTTADNGATTAGTVSNNGTAQSGLRALPAAYLTRRAVSYSPFRSGNRDTETVTDAMVKQDLDLLVAGGIGLIRLFDSSENVSARTLRLINDNHMDLKVHLGVYVNSFEYWNLDAATSANIQSLNDAEVARGVALANSYPSIVLAVSVGNETQVDWSTVNISSRRLAAYIQTVRGQIVQPVTTDDNYAVYAGKLPQHPAENQMSEVLAQIDFASIHTYAIEDAQYSNFADADSWPDWDWRQIGVTDTSKRAAAMMDAALGKTQRDYALARAYMDAKGKAQLPIIIGETGWKAVDPSGTGRYKFLANAANQKMYYDRLLSWVDATKNGSGPKSIIYFEAFDEPWKSSDDKWGLFNVSRQARYAIQGKNPNGGTWIYETKPGNVAYTDADAVFFVPPTLKAAVAASRYTLYADNATAGEVLAKTLTPDMTWDAFDGGTATRNEADASTSATGDGPNSLSIVPNPAFNTVQYGWGLLAHSATDVNDNLFAYAATGSLHFSIKTTYAGKMKIGIATDTEDRSGAEAYVLLSNGDRYGYCNTGVWCDVSIPLSALAAVNPNLDLHYVLNRFIISDKYVDTGNTPGATTKINIDKIYWSK